MPGLFTDGAYRPCGVDAGAILGRSHSSHSLPKLGDPRHSRAPPFTCHIGGFALVPIGRNAFNLYGRFLAFWSCASAPALVIFLGIPDSRCAGVPVAFCGRASLRFFVLLVLLQRVECAALYRPHPLTLTPPVHLPNWGIRASFRCAEVPLTL